MAYRTFSLLILTFLSCSLFAQGALEPLAPPGPTMKTLEQLEPRLPISAAGTISNSGSYYLTNNISGSITLEADDIELDLNGFTITPISSVAIRVSNRDKVRIFNGAVAGGLGTGIFGSLVGSIFIHDVRLKDISGECIELDGLAGLIRIERTVCEGGTRAGIVIKQNVDGTLYAVIRDNIIANINTATNVSTHSLGIFHNANGELHVVVTGNQLLNNRSFGMEIRQGDATGNGRVTDNLAIGHGGLGFLILADVMFARNYAADNSPNYNVTSTRAAPQTALDDSPGPYDNISE